MTRPMKKLLTLAAFLTACTPLLTIYAYADEIAVPDEEPVNWLPLLCVAILIVAAAALIDILRRRGKK